MFWFVFLLVFILGLVVGSFITAYTHRTVRGKSVAKGRSICPSCKHKISWYDNIPLFSYLLLGGKCRSCRRRISIRYPLIEISTALVFVLVKNAYHQCALGANSILPSSTAICFWKEGLGLLLLPYLIFVVSALIALYVTDIEEQIIPDTLSYSLFAITLAMLIVVSPDDLFFRLFFGIFLSFSFLILHIITLGRGMGLGDVKLVLFAGMFLGFKLSLVWIFLSFVIGASVGVLLILASKAKFGKQIAFGPFLIVSFFLIVFFGDFLFEKLFPYLK